MPGVALQGTAPPQACLQGLKDSWRLCDDADLATDNSRCGTSQPVGSEFGHKLRSQLPRNESYSASFIADVVRHRDIPAPQSSWENLAGLSVTYSQPAAHP